MIYTTDNGAETFTWPDGGTTPFKGEKNTNWEGGYRVPAMVRWPGLVPAHTEINDIFSAEDWATTLVAAAGEPDMKEKLLQGYSAAGQTFKVHLDGYDQRDLLSRKGPDKRREFFYWTDDGNLAGLRYEQWKAVFLEQKAEGFSVWQQPMIQLRLPMLFNLRLIRSSGRSTSPATTYDGSLSTPSWLSRRRRSWDSISRASCNSAAPKARFVLGRTGAGKAEAAAVQ